MTVGAPTKILLQGGMEPFVEEALAGRFEILREPDLGLESILAGHGDQIAAVVTRGSLHVGPELMDRLPALAVIAHVAVGYDSTDVAAAVRRGIVVTHTPDVLNDEMADFTIGLLIATVRRIPQAERHLRDGLWASGHSFPLSASLRGRTIGIAGLGRIGAVVARRLEGFDLPIAYYARRRRPDCRHAYYDDLRALAQAVDTLIVVLPGGPATRHVVGAEVLEALGPDGILINVARGSVVDEDALIEALRTGRLRAAGLDVFEHEPVVPAALLAMDQVVLLPHFGTATRHTRILMAELAVANLIALLGGKAALTPVPECLGMAPKKRGSALHPAGSRGEQPGHANA